MNRIEQRALLVVLACVALATASVLRDCVSPAYAQRSHSSPWARTPAQAALLARVIVNENSSMLLPNRTWDAVETEWFAAVAINSRQRFAAHGWLDVIARLAPHVGLLRPYTRPRQEWTSTLHGCTEAKPTLWVDARDGDWNLYSLRWQSFCLDVREYWLRAKAPINADVMAWGSIADSERQLCRPRPRLCLITRFPGGNLFFGRVGAASCNDALREEFVEARCEGGLR